MSEIAYLGWFDDNPKKPVEQKIDEAVSRYVNRFGRQPNLCLVHRDVQAAHGTIEVRPAGHVNRHCFLVAHVPPAA